MQQKILFSFYLLLFSLSGFAGLIYESIWVQYLKLLLGHSAYAQLLVLVIFMGGMALGAWICAKKSYKIKNLFKAYALIELTLGIFGISFHPIFINVDAFLQESLLPYFESPIAVNGILWATGALLMLPQSLLLGATFPLMTGGILRLFSENSGRSIALLYFFNSIGGAIGVLISGFFLINFVGLPGTILTAGIINSVIALCIWFTAMPIPYHPAKKIKEPLFLLTPVVLLACSFLTGFASFMYEIGWIRMLSMVLGASTHAFELMLSAFILGLSLGSLYVFKIIDTLKSPLKTLAYTQIIMGIMALLTLPIYNYTYEPFAFVLQILPKTVQGYDLFNLFSHGLCFIFMLPATFCAGMTLPLLTKILLSKGHGEKSVGQIYALNTLGAIAGAILAQQFLMPNFGLKTVISFGGIIDILVGLVILFGIYQTFKNIAFITASAICLLFSTSIVCLINLNPIKMASGVFRHGKLPAEGTFKVKFHKDGKTSTISLVEDNETLFIQTNGKTDASISLKENMPTGDEFTQTMSAVLPWSFFPEAENIAVIGLGSGMTTHSLLKIPSVVKVDTIEIEPAMIEGAKLFGEPVKSAFEDKRSNIIIEDARSFFTRTRNQYDLIISEPSNPWVSGVSNLFTEEFYQLVRNNLSPNGIFVQWIHLYDISPSLVASIFNTIGKNFKYYTTYFTNESDILIISSNQNPLVQPSQKMFSIPEVKTALKRLAITDLDDFNLRKLGDRKQLEPFFKTFQTNTNSDFFPILDLNINKARFLLKNFFNLINLKHMLPSFALFREHAVAIHPDQKSSFMISRKIQKANSIYNTLVFDPKSKALDNNLHISLSEIQNPYALCQGEIAENVWFFSFKNILEQTVPYLTEEQSLNLWNKIKPTGCIANASKRVQNWVKLYDNFIHQNYSGLLDASENIISDSKHPEDHIPAVEFKAFAQIKLGKIKEARITLGAYLLEEDASLQLRYLTALLNSDPQPPINQ